VEPGKYARIERERRFLVDGLPAIQPAADRLITDLYLDGTTLRLRLSVQADGSHDRLQVFRKLTPKIPAPADAPRCVQGWLTNTSLSEAEYLECPRHVAVGADDVDADPLVVGWRTFGQRMSDRGAALPWPSCSTANSDAR
jgi:hypothetical protein